MKITYSACECAMDSNVKIVAIVGIEDLKEFLKVLRIEPSYFNPDFVNLSFNLFLFLISNENWTRFVNASNVYYSTTIQYEVKEAPVDFDINDFYPCRPDVINYILNNKNKTNRLISNANLLARTH